MHEHTAPKPSTPRFRKDVAWTVVSARLDEQGKTLRVRKTARRLIELAGDDGVVRHTLREIAAGITTQRGTPMLPRNVQEDLAELRAIGLLLDGQNGRASYAWNSNELRAAFAGGVPALAASNGERVEARKGEFPSDTETTPAAGGVDRSVWAAIRDGYCLARKQHWRQLADVEAHVSEPDEAGKARLVSVALQVAARRALVTNPAPRLEQITRAMRAVFVLWMERSRWDSIVDQRHPLSWSADDRSVVKLLAYGVEAFPTPRHAEPADAPRAEAPPAPPPAFNFAAATKALEALEALDRRKAVGA